MPGATDDPVKFSLAQCIGEALARTFPDKAASLQSECSPDVIFQLLEQPPQPEMGDYALPCFRFAKTLKQKPILIAERLSEQVSGPWIQSIKLAGAFLNIVTDKTQLAKLTIGETLDGSYFKRLLGSPPAANRRVMIEFSQPNTHKEFHIGHGRNVCLGDAICRLFKNAGHDVIGVNYIGDEGTHVAKCLWEIERSGEPLPDTNHVEWYGKKYAAASRRLEEANDNREAYQQEVSNVLGQLEKRQGTYFDLWQRTRKDCLEDFDRTYEWLDVSFDHVFYESEVSEASQEIVDEFIEKGLFKESEGAYGIDMSEWKLGFFMARKSDGTTLYITKDLALARVKFEQFRIDRSIYVVASEQNFHFKQLFKALELMGFEQADQCHHLSYAHVKLPDGKMSSRKGTAVNFNDLISLIQNQLDEYLSKYKDNWSADEIAQTGHRLTVAAIKYGMLVSDPSRDIVFDPKEWTSFEGHSGPYLCYSYARTQSILRKCSDEGHVHSTKNLSLLKDDSEHELLRFIYDVNRVSKLACEQYKPSMLCNHLYNLCKAFNRFYAKQSVLNADNSELRGARLALVASASATLHHGLGLIGISPPERM